MEDIVEPNSEGDTTQTKSHEDASTIKKQIEQTELKIQDLNDAMGGDNGLHNISQELTKNYPNTQDAINDLMTKANDTSDKAKELTKKLAQSIYSELSKTGLDKEKVNKYYTLIFAHAKKLVDRNQLKVKLSVLQNTLDNIAPHAKLNLSDSAIPGNKMQESNNKIIQTLKEKKKELLKIQEALAPVKKLNANQLIDMSHRIYDSAAFSDAMKAKLNIAGGILENLQFRRTIDDARGAVSDGLMTSAERESKFTALTRNAFRPSLSIKANIAKSVLKGVTLIGGSVGITSMANAADLEKPVTDAMDAIDPTAILHSEDLGGKCGDMVPSILITRNPERGCQFDFNFNKKIYETFLRSEVKDLEGFFKDTGVCDFISTNYDKYYPRTNLKTINCNSPNVVVNFNNNSSINVGADSIRFTPANEERSIKYLLDPKEKKNFVFVGDGKHVNYSSAETAEKFPEKYVAVSAMMAAALEIESCCHSDTGARPSEEDCGKYGIHTGNNLGGKPENSNYTNGANSR